MTHAERSHAIWAPSMGDRWAEEGGCTAAPLAIAQLPEQESGEAAQKGTAAHEEIERCFGALNGEFVDPATMPIEPVDPDHPSAYGVALMIAYVRGLPPGRIWVEKRVHLTKHIHGTPDVRHWHEESATLTVPDYKDGFIGVDAMSAQFRIYAAGAIWPLDEPGLPAKWVRYACVQPNDFRPGPRVKQDVESIDALYAWIQRVAAIPNGPYEFRPGEHCRYCPLFGRCEPTRDLLAHLGVAMQHTPDEVPAATRATFLTLQKPIEDWFKGASKAWTKDAMAGKAAPGLKLVQTMKHRAWKNEAEARRLILEKFGPDALDVPTPASVEKLGLDVAALTERPDGGPALAFASDKRAEWRTKSASEMFAGVTGK